MLNLKEQIQLEMILNDDSPILNEEVGSVILGFLASNAIFIAAGAIIGARIGRDMTPKYKEIKKRQTKCDHLEGKGKKVCKIQVLLLYNKEIYSKLKSLKGTCSKASNPEKCQKWFLKNLQKLERSIQALEFKLKKEKRA
jgi:predicted RNase H-like nuclease (RuvC/YqgF family)